MKRALRLRASAQVSGSPDAVYERVANPAHRREWMVELDTQDADHRLEVGDAFDGTTSVLGHRFVGTSHIEQSDPGEALRERVMIGARVVSTWTFTRSGEGTRVEHHLDVDLPRGPLAPVARLVLRARLGRIQRRSLDALTRHLDDRGSG